MSSLLTSLIMERVQFFPRDVIRGKVEKVGDRFNALFLGVECDWEVVEMGAGCFFAKWIGDQS